MDTEIRIRSRAPTRIDLAGGTVDIWPLYLFLTEPVTLNAGIDLYAEADLSCKTARGKGSIRLRSEDQGIELELDSRQLLEKPTVPPALELHFKLLRFFAGKKGLDELSRLDVFLSTRARSPAGAGLGGSSALSIALIGALASWVKGSPIDPESQGEKFIEITRDVETTVIRVPAGLQDYYGAMFGGLQSIRWLPGEHQRERLPSAVCLGLEKRLLLFYSGQSRNSGINNWALFKGLIDQQGGVLSKFEEIARATRELEKALLDLDWEAAGKSIEEEWSVRKSLASGITTESMERALSRASQSTRVVGKVCGAGGGGCFFAFVPSGKDAEKSEVERIFVEEGMRRLPFRIVPRGLEVSFDGEAHGP